MKKIIVLLLVLCLTLGCVYPIFALDITIDPPVFNNAMNSISVSGTVASTTGGIPMTLAITDSNGTFVAGTQTVSEKSMNGIVKYSFETIYLPFTAPGDDYVITVSGHHVDSIKQTTLTIPPADGLLSLLQGIKNTQTPYEFVASHTEDFGVDREEFSLLLKGQNIFNTIINGKNYVLPPDVTTAERIRETKELLQTVCQDVLDAHDIAEFSDISTQTALIEWIDNNYSSNGFDVNSEVTAESEQELTKYVELIKSEPEFLERISSKTGLIMKEMIQTALYESALLTTISTQSDYRIINAISSFSSFFPLGSLTEAQIATRCEQIAGNYYNSYADVVQAILQIQQGTPSNDSNRGNSWGSTGDIVYTPQTETAKVQSFSDLGNVPWASEAIEALAKKGIINGKEQGVFAPTAYITRAEYIKILLLAAGYTPSSNAEPAFEDVSLNSWYAPYIALASQKGIANGTDDGRFMPEANITRQDAMVLLYRVLSITKEETDAEFRDFDEVADYAKDAVLTLYSKGIIDGVGEGYFMPLELMNRAQAAKVLYKALGN